MINKYEKAKIRLEHNSVFDKEFTEDSDDISAAVEALEKQIPVKPKRYKCKNDLMYDTCLCPSCAMPVSQDYNEQFCPNCGQALDWNNADG